MKGCCLWLLACKSMQNKCMDGGGAKALFLVSHAYSHRSVLNKDRLQSPYFDPDGFSYSQPPAQLLMRQFSVWNF